MMSLKLDTNNMNLITIAERGKSFLSLSLTRTNAGTEINNYPLYDVRYSRLPLTGSIVIHGIFDKLVYKKHNTSYITFIRRLMLEYAIAHPFDKTPFMDRSYKRAPIDITCTITTKEAGCLALSLDPSDYVSSTGRRPYTMVTLRRPVASLNPAREELEGNIFHDEADGYIPLLLSGLDKYKEVNPYDTDFFYR